MTLETNKKMELNELELMNVNGGNWFGDLWDDVCDWCDENTDALIYVGCIAGGIALCATGIGAAAGIGLIAVESVGSAAVISAAVGGVIGAGAADIITYED